MLIRKERNIPEIPVPKCALFCTRASPTDPSAIVAIQPSPFQDHVGPEHTHLSVSGPPSTASVSSRLVVPCITKSRDLPMTDNGSANAVAMAKHLGNEDKSSAYASAAKDLEEPRPRGYRRGPVTRWRCPGLGRNHTPRLSRGHPAHHALLHRREPSKGGNRRHSQHSEKLRQP